MTNSEKLEARRIADELYKAHCAFIKADLPGLHPDSMDTVKLARMIRIFQGTVEPTPMSKIELAQRNFSENL